MSAIHSIELIALAILILTAARPLWAKGRVLSLTFWPSLGLVTISSGALAAALILNGWHTDFGTALWATVAASTLLFAAIAAGNRRMEGLAVLLLPYLAALGFIATLVKGEPHPMTAALSNAWVDLHIGLAVAITGFLTIAAVAATALSLQERALKLKIARWYQPILPSVSESEGLSGRLLLLAEVLLGIGLATGVAINVLETGTLLRFDHKTLLSVIAFFLIGALLIGHRVCGVRGRLAARVVLVAYLLVMLASPGVKFVTQVLLTP